MNIAIIPARSGSVRLKDKNILDFHGYPLLMRTVITAFESNKFDIIHVSTDSVRIANIVRRYGVTVPTLRSKKNSQADSSAMAVIVEVVNYYEIQGIKIDNIALLQPTSPLRTKSDIFNAFELLKSDVYSVISVTPNHSKVKEVDEYLKKKEYLTSQEFRNIFGDYILNGAIYLLRRENIGEYPYFTESTKLLEMNPERSIDIDTFDDYLLALRLYEDSQSK